MGEGPTEKFLIFFCLTLTPTLSRLAGEGLQAVQVYARTLDSGH